MEITGTFLGWLLDLLAPGIAERIRRRHVARDVVPAIAREIEETGLTLAILAWRVRGYLGTVDAAFAKWLADYIAQYQGTDRELVAIKQFQDPERVQRDARSLLQRSPAHGLDLKEYHLPMTDSKLSELSLCPQEFCARVLQFKQQLEFLNSDARAANADARRTFDAGLTAENHAALMTNQRRFYERIAERAKSMATDAQELVGRPQT